MMFILHPKLITIQVNIKFSGDGLDAKIALTSKINNAKPALKNAKPVSPKQCALLAKTIHFYFSRVIAQTALF